MAELKKIEDFQYDNIQIADESIRKPDTQKEFVVKKVQENQNLPQSPNRKLKNISFLEKSVVCLLIISIITVAVSTVQLRTSITKTVSEITKTQVEIKEKQEEIDKYEQQKNELSKTDRIKEIAKSKGLSDNIDNIRKVD